MEHHFLIPATATARQALRQLNALGIPAPVLFIADEMGTVLGSLSDGDVRRGLLAELSVDAPVTEFMKREFRFLSDETFGKTQLRELRALHLRFVPVLDAGRRLVRILDLAEVRDRLPVAAVIMAGGRGERLRPLTDATPKPMLRVGDKPILEHNLDHLLRFGITDLTISVRYLGEQIEGYFADGSAKGATIRYLHEDQPLGTMGALSTLPEINQEYLLVLNSDLLTNLDFSEFFEAFLENGADLAVATVPYEVDVPFAVFELGEGNRVRAFREKPRYVHPCNAGIYLLKKELLGLIPAGEHFDATDFMNRVLAEGRTILAEPIRGYWLDIGRMDDYRQAQHDIKHLKWT
jgi:dTDP-glucose pyrophosphorylase